ncbi:glucose-6-phosphate dehydrogenase [Opisthorchis viverrini]|uniref:glucose-6-phosphate dehydrogenase (NADP(+)) n=1 Tax=Opisthorchis viverrini TaxID=6198 RepID=A0A1S8WFW1_OPIVI|nr:glucose-6-phosphate dehydrogenase [Opisthorchis viverrini]
MSATSDVSDCLDLIKETIEEDQAHTHVIVVFGASTYRWLFRDGLLPAKTYVIGYARSPLSVVKIRIHSEPYMKVLPDNLELFENFWSRNYYIQGDYSDSAGFQELNRFIETNWGKHVNRVFYLAVPPTVYMPITSNIHKCCMSESPAVWTRLIIEKPFGHDLSSSNALSAHLAERFTESQIYRIDHYLGKEMVQNLIMLRFPSLIPRSFSNHILNSLWNCDHIDNVTISFKEPFGTEGRGGYFDQFGIIRDVVQNHLMQILSLIAMEQPKSLGADDIRNEKKSYGDRVADEKLRSSKFSFPPHLFSLIIRITFADSITPTYVCMLLRLNTERWRNVPFVLRAGKALNERKAEVRIQFKDLSLMLFGSDPTPRNELVIRVQPDEAVYMKLNTKSPGMKFHTEETELDLTYSKRYQHVKLPDAYERLLLDVFCGIQTNFVRNDELEEAWRILTPVLEQLEKNCVKPLPYIYGSRDGPDAGSLLRKRAGYRYSGTYSWSSDTHNKTV